MDESHTLSLFDLFQQGNWVMWPLLLCSILAVTIVFERLFYGMSRKRVLPLRLTASVEELLAANKIEDIFRLCSDNGSPLSRILLAGLRNANRPRQEIVEALEFAGRREFSLLNRNVGILGTIAAISPLLGLFGTVVGMIESFSVIKQVGIGNPALLAGGISQALVATASGIGIAIPSVIFFRFFQQRSRGLTLELEEYALKILSKLSA